VTNATGQAEEVTWESLIPQEHWDIYKCVLDRVADQQIPFALGGGLALGVYTQKFRRSKDLDIYIMPEHCERVIDEMSHCGLEDYYSVKEYVRHWIYRGHRDDVIVDAIWAMANRRASVDERWVTTGPMVQMFGQEFRVIPAEELLWSKLYVLQRDRCDWPDIMNLVYAAGPTLDWNHLISRVAEDHPLLKGVLSVFSWVSPQRAAKIPAHIWERLGLSVPKSERDPEGRPTRKDLLDTRPWLFVEHPQTAAA
jgi:hypothetical protein